MNIPKNKDKTFYADINIFFSTYLPVYIHKVFNFHKTEVWTNNLSGKKNRIYLLTLLTGYHH